MHTYYFEIVFVCALLLHSILVIRLQCYYYIMILSCTATILYGQRKFYMSISIHKNKQIRKIVNVYKRFVCTPPMQSVRFVFLSTIMKADRPSQVLMHTQRYNAQLYYSILLCIILYFKCYYLSKTCVISTLSTLFF